MAPQTAEAPADLLAEIGSVIKEYPPLDDDPARATAVATALLAGVQEPDAPADIATDLVGMVAELEANRAGPILRRFSELGRPTIAAAARDALAALAHAEPPNDPALALIEAWRVEAPDADALTLDLGRGGDVESRAFLLRDRRTDPAGVLIAGCAGAPTTDETLWEVLPELDDAGEPEQLDREQVAEWIRAGYSKAVEHGDPIPAGLSVALTLLAKPIFGDGDALPALEVDPTDAIYGDPDPSLVVDVAQDEGAAYVTIESLLAEYEQYLAGRPKLLKTVSVGTCLFVAQTMLDYSANNLEGALGDWTVSDLAEFMLDFWPRKVVADRVTELDAPVAVLRFLRFLDERGSLSGNSPEQLVDAMRDLLGDFVDACSDPSSWGPGKSGLMEAAEAGVDIHDRRALEAYFNQLAPRPGPVTRPQQSAQKQRRARRKSARTARRRNRR